MDSDALLAARRWGAILLMSSRDKGDVTEIIELYLKVEVNFLKGLSEEVLLSSIIDLIKQSREGMIDKFFRETVFPTLGKQARERAIGTAGNRAASVELTATATERKKRMEALHGQLLRQCDNAIDQAEAIKKDREAGL